MMILFMKTRAMVLNNVRNNKKYLNNLLILHTQMVNLVNGNNFVLLVPANNIL